MLRRTCESTLSSALLVTSSPVAAHLASPAEVRVAPMAPGLAPPSTSFFNILSDSAFGHCESCILSCARERHRTVLHIL